MSLSRSRCIAIAGILAVCTAAFSPAFAQTGVSRPKFDAFEVATIKPVAADVHSGRLFRMDGPHRWLATDYTLKNLIALAYDLSPRTISGGPGWMESQHFNIEAITPGDLRPSRLEQMQMLRALLVERFALQFHRQDKEFAIYELTVAKGGPRLKPAAQPDAPPELVGVVYPGMLLVAEGVHGLPEAVVEEGLDLAAGDEGFDGLALEHLRSSLISSMTLGRGRRSRR
jgi:hypothetical protein